VFARSPCLAAGSCLRPTRFPAGSGLPGRVGSRPTRVRGLLRDSGAAGELAAVYGRIGTTLQAFGHGRGELGSFDVLTC